LALLILGLAPPHVDSHPLAQETTRSRIAATLEIDLPTLPEAARAYSVFDESGATVLIQRKHVVIAEPNAAEGITGIEIKTTPGRGSISVRVIAVYNDLSQPDWWRNQKGRFVCTLVINDGESAKPAELAQVGIEPFELRAVNPNGVVLGPGEGPVLINETTSLECVNIRKRGHAYIVTIKNSSDKEVLGFQVIIGNSGVGHGGPGVVLAPGATREVSAFRPGPEDGDY
jgi:hypothetical protein